MRRKDREVIDNTEILSILKKSNTIRIGMYDDEFPYIVPVSFGFEIIDQKPVVYFHSATQGMKIELLARNPNVCVEADNFFKVQKTTHGITARYESIIGFGKCEEVYNKEEIIKGLRLILEHYEYGDYPLERCGEIINVKIYRIMLDKITGKLNPVEE